MGYEVRWEARGAIKRFFGDVSGTDMIRPVVEIEADPRFDTLKYVINDFLAATSVSARTDDVDYVAAADAGAARTNPDILVAVVTTSPDVIAMTTQYTTSNLDIYPLRLFETVADARGWIEAASGLTLPRP